VARISAVRFGNAGKVVEGFVGVYGWVVMDVKTH